MSLSKKIGFFWGEEKITVVELEKNTPLQVIFASLAVKPDSATPFSSGLAEEIRISAVIKKIVQDYHIEAGDVYVSLPLKDVILRSFVVPLVKPNELNAVVEFEAKKHMPFEMKELSFVFHTVIFTDDKIKRMRIVLFAIRRNTLEHYERIFKQAGLDISFCEPSPMSLVKALAFKKDIRLEERFVFLYLDQNLGQIYFINKGIPQFIREFAMAQGTSSVLEAGLNPESLQMRLFYEVRNSFDFYARQFNEGKMEEMLVLSTPQHQEDLDNLAVDLGVKIKNFTPTVTAGAVQVRDMEAVYALGVCVDGGHFAALPLFNFFQKKTTASAALRQSIFFNIQEYAGVFKTALICLVLLVGTAIALQVQLKGMHKKVDGLALQQKTFINTPLEDLKAKIEQNTATLSMYKNIRTKSDIAFILARISSLLPQGVWLGDLKISYKGDEGKAQVIIEMNGHAFSADVDQQIRAVNEIVLNFKNSKELVKYISNVTLVSVQQEDAQDGRTITSFIIHCS